MKRYSLKIGSNIHNWGDALGLALFKKISGVDPVCIRMKEKSTLVLPAFLTVGSILNHADSNSIVWGSGFIGEDQLVKEIPAKICAVRGPESRRKLLEQGINCPEIYGDPALLFPRFYKPEVQKKYKLGIIPHYTDKENPWVKEIEKISGIKIIDIEGDIYKVVDEINSCERIASSSLHGIIVADAYGIPSTWIELSDKVIGKGFKFRDYFESVGRKDRSSLIIREGTTLEEIYAQFYDYKIDIDLDKLYEACPFRPELLV